MNSEKTTTRKGFLTRAGLAFVGAFALARAASSESKSKPTQFASTTEPRAMSRIRAAKGAVERKSV
ncbi:MAG: hypothetical protein P8M62_04170 [Opitutae bacterium]|nr:hypothetical protein [Opitutae bacterium]MDG2345236.1 hypothetical protein [Opitutae bacterium]